MFPLHEKSRTTIPVFGNKEGMSGMEALHEACQACHPQTQSLFCLFKIPSSSFKSQR